MKRKQLIRCARGFTLIETMIVVVMIGILAGLTIPAFGKYLRTQKIQGARNELMADISYTRSLAISRRGTFQLVFGANSYTVVQTGPNTVVLNRTAPTGVTYTASADPNFYAFGLADAAAVQIKSGADLSNVNVLPNGTVTHD